MANQSVALRYVGRWNSWLARYRWSRTVMCNRFLPTYVLLKDQRRSSGLIQANVITNGCPLLQCLYSSYTSLTLSNYGTFHLACLKSTFPCSPLAVRPDKTFLVGRTNPLALESYWTMPAIYLTRTTTRICDIN